MKVVVLSALGNEAARACVGSLLETAPDAGFDLLLVRERGMRERTLNAALDLAGRDEDVLLVGDDIRFTPGWWEALVAGAGRADVVGLCMLDARTGRIQDRGYDLARVDEELTLLARDRGEAPERVAPFGFRACDALCGCLMWVAARVLRDVPRFQEEGRNRWGELIFACEARRKGHRVGVVDHALVHGGVGTKANPDLALRSTSWHFEREAFGEVVARWVDPDWVRIRRRSRLDPALARRLRDAAQRVLVYGVGTVAHRIVAELGADAARLTFCSGLPEEAGLGFAGQKVRPISEVRPEQFDWVLVTPLHRGETIYADTLQPLLPPDWKGDVTAVEVEWRGEERVLRGRELRPRAPAAAAGAAP